MSTNDPIGLEYYHPLKTAEIISDITFYVSAALSVSLLLINKEIYTSVYTCIQAIFVITVVAMFLIGIIIRTYFATRAHSSRFADFISNAFDVPLVPSPSNGYYNTPLGDPFLRMGASALENTLFTKFILAKMLIFERARVGVYLLVWLWAALYRAADLELIAVAAQVLFSEQIISRWMRMEWLRSRVERLYDDLYALIQSTSDLKSKLFRARVVEAVLRYETSKAQAGLSISTRIFHMLNVDLSSRWRSICSQLGIGPTPASSP